MKNLFLLYLIYRGKNLAPSLSMGLYLISLSFKKDYTKSDFELIDF